MNGGNYDESNNTNIIFAINQSSACYHNKMCRADFLV